MRYAQLLLEFDVQMTANQIGSKIASRLEVDSADILYSMKVEALHEIGKRVNAAFTSPEERREIKAIVARKAVEYIVMHDPTDKKSYSRWLCQRYADGGIERTDDLDKATNFLRTFDRLKTGGYFKRNPDVAHMADIGRVRTLSDLGEFLMSIPDTDALSNAGQERALEARLIESGAARVILNTDRFKVTVPTTAEAATFYGRNTQWCTTSENGGQFDYYSKQGPLYIILDKPNNRRWQFHYETQQFMDENDRQVTRKVRDPEEDRWDDSYAPDKYITVYDRFPYEFFEVIPGEMMLRGPDKLPKERGKPRANWRRVKEEDFAGLTQSALLEVAKTVEDKTVSRAAVKFMDITTKAIMYRLGVTSRNRNYYWFSTAVLGDLQKTKVDVVETESHGHKCAYGQLLDLLIHDLKADRQGGEDIWTLAPVNVDGMRSFKPAWTNCVLVYGSRSTVLAQYRHGQIAYVLIDEDGLFDEKIHGPGAAWIQTTREKLEKEGPAGRAKGLSPNQALAVADLFSHFVG